MGSYKFSKDLNATMARADDDTYRVRRRVLENENKFEDNTFVSEPRDPEYPPLAG